MSGSAPTVPIRVGEIAPSPEFFTIRSAVEVLPYPDGRHDHDVALCNDTLRLYGAIDGMGQYAGARQAADETHDGLTASVGRNVRNLNYGNAVDYMHEAFTDSQARVSDYASRHDGCPDMGAVAAAGHFFEQDGRVFFTYGIVGDAQFMLLRPSTGEIFASVEEALAPGELGSKGQIVTNAIQAGGRPKLDQFGIIEVRHGDRMLIMSDGITGDADDQRLRPEELRQAMLLSDPQEVASYLISVSRKHDDKTVVVADVITMSGDASAPVLAPSDNLIHHRFEPSGRLVQVGGPQAGRLGRDSAETLARIYRETEEGAHNLRIHGIVTRLLSDLLSVGLVDTWIPLAELAGWSVTDDGEFVRQALKTAGINLKNTAKYYESGERVARVLYEWINQMDAAMRMQSVRQDMRRGCQVTVLKPGLWGTAGRLEGGWTIDRMLPSGLFRVVSGRRAVTVAATDLVRWQRGEI